MEPLVGIAKLAAASPSLEAKRLVEYRELTSRSYVTPCLSPRMPFRWQINPYRGCEFGCKYCYARYTHEFMELREGQQFERKIFVKHFEPAVFARELAKLPVGEVIAIGSATDPYQPAERRFRVTRRMLEVLAGTAGLGIGLITKSDLIARDKDLLSEVSRRHKLTLAMTITTVDRDLARLLEPMAPQPDLRLAAVRKLAGAGLRVRISCAPVMPLINDSEESLGALARAASEAGAFGMWGQALFLKPCAKAVFLPFLEEKFPHLVRRYKERYERAAYLKGDYPEMVSERLERVRTRYGLNRKHKEDDPTPELWPVEAQMSLFER